MDSLPLSHLLTADSSLNYESSDTDYEKTTSADDSLCAAARKVIICCALLASAIVICRVGRFDHFHIRFSFGRFFY